jgi:hypothetical protein
MLRAVKSCGLKSRGLRGFKVIKMLIRDDRIDQTRAAKSTAKIFRFHCIGRYYARDLVA